MQKSLNGYDLETPDFYRWQVEYTVSELTELFQRKSGLDIGTITDLKPLKRGGSGRIIELEVTGSRRSIVIGKELEIRRVLSESHLYSSAFVVSKEYDSQGNISKIVLNGAGWGHGVGMSQYGARAMALEGKTYDEILANAKNANPVEDAYSVLIDELNRAINKVLFPAATVESVDPACGHYTEMPGTFKLTFSADVQALEFGMVRTDFTGFRGYNLSEEDYTINGKELTVTVPAEYVTETELTGKGYLTANDLTFAEDGDIDALFTTSL